MLCRLALQTPGCGHPCNDFLLPSAGFFRQEEPFELLTKWGREAVLGLDGTLALLSPLALSGGELEKLSPGASQLRQHGRRDRDHGRGRGARVRQEDHPRQPAAQDTSEVRPVGVLAVEVFICLFWTVSPLASDTKEGAKGRVRFSVAPLVCGLH